MIPEWNREIITHIWGQKVLILNQKTSSITNVVDVLKIVMATSYLDFVHIFVYLPMEFTILLFQSLLGEFQWKFLRTAVDILDLYQRGSEEREFIPSSWRIISKENEVHHVHFPTTLFFYSMCTEKSVFWVTEGPKN